MVAEMVAVKADYSVLLKAVLMVAMRVLMRAVKRDFPKAFSKVGRTAEMKVGSLVGS